MPNYVTDYEEAVELLYRIPRFNSNHSLQKIKKFLIRMGQPDRQMKIVHIAGTNGKGSTSVYLAGLLEQAGLKVGLFTSPHLVDVRERFQINGRMISKELFTEAVQYIQRGLHEALEAGEDYQPCYFDMMFFIGMYVFQKEQVDILILETGLGGRMDATNAVADKVLTLITHIGLDHTEYLGDTLEAIAAEKAGIMRAKIPCIVAPGNDSVVQVFVKKAAELESRCRILGKANYACQGVYEKSVDFSYFSSYYGTVPVKLNTTALYQADNVCLALAGFENLIEQGIVSEKDLPVEKLTQALWKTSWAGRMEEVLEGVFLDGAHNTDGITAFLRSVETDGCQGQRIIIFSAVSDKNYGLMLGDIFRSGLFKQVIVTQIAGERGVAAERLYEEACHQRRKALIQDEDVCCLQNPDIFSAIKQAFTKRKHSDYIYIVGSLYLVGQTKQLLSNHSEFSGEEGEPI